MEATMVTVKIGGRRFIRRNKPEPPSTHLRITRAHPGYTEGKKCGDRSNKLKEEDVRRPKKAQSCCHRRRSGRPKQIEMKEEDGTEAEEGSKRDIRFR